MADRSSFTCSAYSPGTVFAVTFQSRNMFYFIIIIFLKSGLDVVDHLFSLKP